MKPPPFDYHAPTSTEGVLHLLAEYGDEAKLLAGGQSLMPMLNFRLLAPRVIVDVNRLPALAEIEHSNDVVEVGALVRHGSMERSSVAAVHLPIVCAALRYVGHLAIRNRGTLVGSLCHADPAAELPALALVLNAIFTVRRSDDERKVAAADFFRGPLETALEPEDLVTSVGFEAMQRDAGWGFHEIARRMGDFAMAGAAVTLTSHEAMIREARVAVFGVDEQPKRLAALEQAMLGKPLGNTDLWRGDLEDAVNDLKPMADLHASADFRRHLAATVVRRAFLEASERSAAV